MACDPPQLREKDLQADRRPSPQGDYLAAKTNGDIAMSAGMTPRVDGKLIVTGRVGKTIPVEHAAQAAGLAAGNALRALISELGGQDRIDDCLRMTVYIACGADFTEHSTVADGASAEIFNWLGAEFLPSRAAVGVASLPGGAPVEVELTVAVRNRDRTDRTQ